MMIKMVGKLILIWYQRAPRLLVDYNDQNGGMGINYDASDEDGDGKDGEIGIGKEGRRIGEAASLLGRH